MNKQLYTALNEHFNFEVESAYLYMAMAAYMDKKGMGGFSHFLTQQAKEEMEHAEKFYHFIDEMQETVTYTGIPEPKAEYGTFTETFQNALEHEKEVTQRIHDLYKLAEDEGCRNTQEFLNWFIMEQREEEKTFADIVERMERIAENWSGLYIYDAQMAQR